MDTHLKAEKQSSRMVEIEGESFIVIDHLEEMSDFFLSVVSADDHWFFASTSGALSAGRKSPDNALFPYYTVDKIQANWNSTGPQTIIHCNGITWEPFKPHNTWRHPIERRIYKNLNGDSILFEEINKQLDLCFRYRWRTSAKFGFIRTVSLQNQGTEEHELNVVDGLADILPSGIDARTQLSYSCLVDAYRLSELDPANKLLVHRMAASLIDEAIPLECLLATTVWSVGWPQSEILLSCEEANNFIEEPLAKEKKSKLRAKKGAYFNAGIMQIPAGESREWTQVADVNSTQSKVADLEEALIQPQALLEEVLEDISRGSEKLNTLIASADGLQVSRDEDMISHHRANVLYNIMRGGVFAEGYQICPDILRGHIAKIHHDLKPDEAAWLSSLPAASISRAELIELVAATSTRLRRTCMEYLPLIFSRRHGDPSRPWNQFTIQTTDERGNPIVGFQGNWRDIFQNWEALAWSFPQYNLAFIHKFLNASTADGYNPYRITSEGIEWEEPDEEDPWASIGYWGDHQIIYLLKLLEFAQNLDATALTEQLEDRDFVFADVPYELKSHSEIEKDPKHTIHFNTARNQLIAERSNRIGADGKLVHDTDGNLRQASLLEKLLLPALVKISNLVPGGGIWMNTQRPEWNDANNALAGNGLSLVTTCYLHRYICFLEGIMDGREGDFTCFQALADFLRSIDKELETDPLTTTATDQARLATMRGLGHIGEHYRQRIYQNNFGKNQSLQIDEIRRFLAKARNHLAHTIRISHRPDGLYHAYNILHIEGETAFIEHLDPMLEGQVAALSSQAISAEQALDILKKLPDSPLYCRRRRSYLLYPDKELPTFLEINKVSAEEAQSLSLIMKMLADKDYRLLVPSGDGCMRFHHSIRNRFEVDTILDQLAKETTFEQAVRTDREKIHDLYEKTFNHKAFTGRSGSMFAYEGLGSIYWHMVSKLMLATLEVTLNNNNDSLFQSLTENYYAIQNGLGFRKSPADYGAFPADAYSHTPSHAGASQPGLTGMVKEGIICRFLELGVNLQESSLRFHPRILRAAELTEKSYSAKIVRADGSESTLEIPPEALLFTIAQTPVIYQRSQAPEARIDIHYLNGKKVTLGTDSLDAETSGSILHRLNQIDYLVVEQPADRFV